MNAQWIADLAASLDLSQRHLPRYDGDADTMLGIPVVLNEWMARDTAYVIRTEDDPWGRMAIVMHPFTAHVVTGSLITGKPMSDPGLQFAAVRHFIERRADQMAAASIRGMADMVRAYELRADHHHRIRWCEVGRYWHRYERPEPDGLMRLVQRCAVCGQEATDESLARAGVR